MVRNKLAIALVVLFFLPATILPNALAGPLAPDVASPYISYQGYIQTAAGAPLNGNVAVRFDITSDAGCASSLWNETHSSVTVTNGYFSAMLGSTTALSASLFSSATRYLKVQVDTGSVFSQVACQQLASVPYAFQAEQAAAVPWSGISSRPAGLDDGDNDTTYTTGTGLGLSGTKIISDTNFIQSRVSGTCAAGSSIRTINQDGSVACETDDNTTYTTGTGLALNGTKIISDTNYLQSRVNGVCAAGNSIRTINQDGSVVCETDSGSSYQNIIVVAQSGGDFTSIQAALDSITATVSNRYLVYVAPGDYNEQVFMEPWVDIEGAGEGETTIQYATAVVTGTLIGADNAEARFLTVKTLSIAPKAIAIYNSNASPRLVHVTARSEMSHAENIPVYNLDGARPLMQTMIIIAQLGDANNFGVYNEGGSPMILDSMIEVSGPFDPAPTFNTYGIYSVPSAAGGLSAPFISNTDIEVTNGKAAYGIYEQGSYTKLNTSRVAVWEGVAENTGFRSTLCGGLTSSDIRHSNIMVTDSIDSPNINYGVRADEACFVQLDSAVVEVVNDEANTNYGLHLFEADALVYNTRITAKDALQNVGVFGNGSARKAEINNSSVITQVSIVGPIHNTLLQMGGYVINAGNTLLSGDAAIGAPGFLKCVFVHDENFNPFAGPACP